MSAAHFEPALVSVLKNGYSRAQFTRDILAGVIVGIVAFPLSIALAIASGVTPKQGLSTAVIAGFCISLFSGSRVQIGGPTGAFIVIVAAVVRQYGYAGLATATLLAGILLILMGIARLGDVIKYIPYPVIVGFTSGIALIIFTAQIKDMLGLDPQHIPEHFFSQWLFFLRAIPQANWWAVSMTVGSIAIIPLWSKLIPLIPGPLAAIVLTTLCARFWHIPIETIGSRFGAMTLGFPAPTLPDISLPALRNLISPAISIALLAGIESLLSAVVADGMTGYRHRSNMELIGQGIANIASPLFGGIPATGAIARTATNIKNGGTTPIAGLIHALVVLLGMLFLGAWVALIPMATLAGILIVVAYNMSEWRLFASILRGQRSDIVVMLITFFLTIFLDLSIAIQAGVILSALLFMRRMIQISTIHNITGTIKAKSAGMDFSFNQQEQPADPDAIVGKDVPPGVEVFEINGPFFFGAAAKFKDAIHDIQKPPRILILRLRHVPVMDATGMRALTDIMEKCKKDKTTLICSGVNHRIQSLWKKNGLDTKIGRANITNHIDAALKRAQEVLADQH